MPRCTIAILGAAFVAGSLFASHTKAFEMPKWNGPSEQAFEKLEICLYDALKNAPVTQPSMTFQDFERLTVDTCRPEREAVKSALVAAGIDAKQATVALAQRYGFARPLISDTYREVVAAKLEKLAGFIRKRGRQAEGAPEVSRSYPIPEADGATDEDVGD